MDYLSILKPGTKIKLGEYGAHSAEIQAVEIRGPERLVTYQVFWWEGSERNSEWITAPEVIESNPGHAKIKLKIT